MRIVNRTRGTELASDALTARGVLTRMVGLLGRSSLASGEGLLIEPCTSVHTAFMRFPIDVLFVDTTGLVVKAVPELRPFRFSGSGHGARCAVELPAGAIEGSGTSVGDTLSFEA